MFKTFILTIALLLLSAEKINHLLINPENDKNVDFHLSEIAEKVKYIKLETNENCVIARISKVLIDNEYVFIKSHQGAISSLYLFNSDGKFICDIGSPGRGPGEYSTVLDFTINSSKKIVYILDTMGKIYSYDFSGRYINTIKITTRPTSILYSDESLFMFTAWPDYNLNDGYAIQIKPLTGTKKDYYLLNRKQIKIPKQPGIAVYHNYFYGKISNNSVCFLESKFDTLYVISSDCSISPKMVIDVINDIPRDLLTVNDYNAAMRTHNTSFNYLYVNNYLFFTLITPDPLIYFYRYNLLTKELLRHNVTKDKNYILNDLDGGLSFKPEGIADDGALYSVLDCEELKQHMSETKKQKVLNPGQSLYLKKLIENSSYTDNPILMIVTLK